MHRTTRRRTAGTAQEVPARWLEPLRTLLPLVAALVTATLGPEWRAGGLLVAGCVVCLCYWFFGAKTPAKVKPREGRRPGSSRTLRA